MWVIKRSVLIISILSLLIGSCNKQKVEKLFEKKSPYEKYIQKLKEINIDKTALGKDWIYAGEQVLKDSIMIQLPFKEVGYFPEEKIRAVGYKFTARRGEVIVINTEWQSRLSGKIFIDLFEQNFSKNIFDPVESADSASNLKYEVKEDKSFLVRLQPELLRGGKYTVTINKEPAYVFPIPGKDDKTVGSFFGMERDGGRRKHEGIDIFVPKRTPVIAITEGRVTGVRENLRGGKVVYLTDFRRNFNLYYAHLDSQMVTIGERVEIGDTLGLVGNTGNAISTPPHLHFGIYNWGYGAVDPLPFVAKSIINFPKIKGNSTYLNISAKAKNKKTFLYGSPFPEASSQVFLEKNTVFQITGLSGNFYRISLLDGQQGYIKIDEAVTIEKPLSSAITKKPVVVFDFPDPLSIVKDSIKTGAEIEVLGRFKEYSLVNYQNEQGWINQLL